MSSVAEIFVLAPEGELRAALPPELAAAQVRSAPLETLADLAAPKKHETRKVLVAATAALGYRAGEILRAVRTIRPEPEIYLICSAAEEPQAIEMVAAGADDYFVAPAGFADLAAAIEGSKRAEVAAPTASTPHPAVPATLSQGRGVMECLGRIAELAHGSSAELAAGAVEALLAVEGVVGAGLWQGADLVAQTGDVTQTRLERKGRPRDEWLRADGPEWIWIAAAAEEPGLALLVRFDVETPRAEFLQSLATVARVLLAIYATARQREAAVKVLSTDAETGLASRTYFERFLAALCRRAVVQQAEVALILVSPTGGGTAATQGRLQALAAIVQQSLTPLKVGRTGPDVVAAVVTDPGAGELKSQLQTLAAALGRSETLAAVGAAAYPWHASDATDLILAAETALRASRSHGSVPVVAGALEELPE